MNVRLNFVNFFDIIEKTQNQNGKEANVMNEIKCPKCGEVFEVN